MSTPTYTLINQITLAAASSTVTFSAVPQSYRDLVLIVEGSVTASLTPSLRFNSDSGSNYSFVSGAGNNNNAVYSTTGTTTFINPAPDFGTPERFNVTYQIMDYSQTDKDKTVLVRYGLNEQSPNMVASRWASTAAITTLTYFASANAFATGTVVSLYGIVG